MKFSEKTESGGQNPLIPWKGDENEEKDRIKMEEMKIKRFPEKWEDNNKY